MALLFFPQGLVAPTPAARTAGDLLGELYPPLGASEASELGFWTAAELTAWLNEALKRLARQVALFVKRDLTTAVEGAEPVYTLPTLHLSTLHVSLDGALLRPANFAELEARSPAWRDESGTPERYLQDHGAGLGSIRLHPTPEAAGTLAIVEHEYVADLTAADPLPLPDPVADYLFVSVLAGARRKESDGAMPEIADYCDGLAGLYEGVFSAYWGSPQ